METGLIHVYHGDGKGKTTAAVGLGVRASGCGKRVIFSQFMKGQETGEIEALGHLPNVTVLRSQKDFPFYSQMSDEQKQEITDIHNDILDKLAEIVASKQAELIIMDEITYPYNWELINRDRFLQLMEACKGNVELVLTGRNPDDIMLDKADYITEMRCLRHPYEKGIKARKGIEF